VNASDFPHHAVIPTTRFRLRTLGGLSVEGRDAPVPAAVTQRKRLAFLALLAAADSHGIARERLLLLLWPESTAERARAALYQLLYVVRQALGDESIAGTDELRLDPRIVWSDVADFQAALASGDLGRAVDLYGGPFLDAVHLSGAPELERWIDQKRQELARGYQSALSRLATHATARADHASAVSYATRLVDADPLSARATMTLMEALAASGDTTAALERAHLHAVVVREELGTDVDPSVSALAERIRARAGGPAPAVVSVSPARTRPDLPEIAPPVPVPSVSAPSVRWRRWTMAIAGAAAVIVGVSLTRQRPRHAATEYVVVADFATDSAASGLADALGDATRRALSASRSLRPLPESRVAAARRRLQVPNGVVLADSFARRVALGEGIRAVVTGSLHSVAGTFALSIRWVSPLSGDVLASAERTGVAMGNLIDVLDTLSQTLRERAGDDLELIRAQPPLMAMTSSSLEAMSLFVAAKRAPDAQAVDLLRRAIALDTAFAGALWQLSYRGARAGRVPVEERRALLKRAYDHREGLTEYERLRVEIAYLYSPEGKTPSRDRLVRNLREIVDQYPNAEDALILAQFYQGRGELAPAESTYHRAIALDSTRLDSWFGLISVLLSDNRVAAARKAVNALPNDFRRREILDREVAYAEGRRDRVRAIFESATQASNDAERSAAYSNLALLDLLEGRLAAMERDVRTADSIGNTARPAPPFPLEALSASFWVRNRPADGLRILDSALVAKPARRVDLRSSMFYSQFGRPSQARSLLAAYDSFTKAEFTQGRERRRALGWILLAEGKPLDAIAEIRASQTMSDGPVDAARIVVDPDIGLAFERAGLRDSAIVAYEHYLNTPVPARIIDHSSRLAWVLEHVADLYAQKGERAKAKAAYERFVDLWRKADAELSR
jgi:DNA-binding SARP family transcriptional activator